MGEQGLLHFKVVTIQEGQIGTDFMERALPEIIRARGPNADSQFHILAHKGYEIKPMIHGLNNRRGNYAPYPCHSRSPRFRFLLGHTFLCK
ncbi:hypothetical protein IAD21_00252 [Abditibacteriota bacterium]|nr:hypothetical protein IAD21_00252 [Abditibacteriota bacterium]